jgi:hypothetical protein
MAARRARAKLRELTTTALIQQDMEPDPGWL